MHKKIDWNAKKMFWISLISEKDYNGEYKNASLGRISFWIVLSIAIWVWIFGTGDITASHLQMLYITATYNLMKKASWFGMTKSNNNVEKEEIAPRIRS